VLYTDGVTEAVDHDFQLFGEARLEAVVRAHLHEPAAAIMEAVLAAVDEFATGEPQFDDMTVMVIKGV